MVLTSFTQLSTATRASYSIIQAGVARGLSSKAINADIALRYGKGIRRQDLLQGMRVAGGVRAEGLNIANVRKDRRPAYDRFPTFSPVTSTKKYLVQYEVRWRDPVTGQTGSRFITVGTDERLMAGELDRAALDAYEQGQQALRYGRSEALTSLVPVGARQQF
jgi:hypothetical protein